MIKENNPITLKPVNVSDYHFLFNLLKERKRYENISHKKIPSYKKHIDFVKSKPYSKWYVIYFDSKKIGSIYLSKQNEIGIHIKRTVSKEKIRNTCLQLIMKMNPRKRYLLNTSSKNKQYIKFLENNGLKLIQHTYEISNPAILTKNEKN